MGRPKLISSSTASLLDYLMLTLIVLGRGQIEPCEANISLKLKSACVLNNTTLIKQYISV